MWSPSMPIQSAQISARSEYLFQRSHTTAQVSLTTNTDGRTRPSPDQDTAPSQTPPGLARAATRTDNTPAAGLSTRLATLDAFRIAMPNTGQAIEDAMAQVENDPGLSLLKALVEALTGKPVETTAISNQPSNPAAAPPANREAPESSGETTAQVSVSLLTEYEYSAVSFEAALTSDDGSQISISFSLEMERYYQETVAEVLIRQGELADPLAINFNGGPVSLDGGQTEFDLNQDGDAEWIPRLAAGNAFLALDRDGNGSIDHGGELFGTQSGNGFADLARYDDDGNDFIDRNDGIFASLSAYRPGEGSLGTLADLGIEALYLGAQKTPFRITGHANQTLAQVRATSFYLSQNLTAGALQQVDLAV